MNVNDTVINVTHLMFTLLFLVDAVHYRRPIITTGLTVPLAIIITIGVCVDDLLAINCLMRIAFNAIAFAPNINVNGFICEPERPRERQQRLPPPFRLKRNISLVDE